MTCKPKIVFTDLDGTLLNSQSICSTENYETLIYLQKKGIVRVIATGRSLFSIHKVLPIEFPVDYVIFSSGAGIIDWQRKRLLHTNSLENDKVVKIGSLFSEMETDFMVHYPIPENHHFVYHRSGKVNKDFERRIEIYKRYAEPLDFALETFGKACQLLAVIPGEQKLFDEISDRIEDVKIIRATSPLDHKSIWIEIFPLSVSKGKAAEWLCDYLNLSRSETVSIGNDYNDIDMLEYTERSFLVKNSPESIKRDFIIVPSNNENGFHFMISNIIK